MCVHVSNAIHLLVLLQGFLRVGARLLHRPLSVLHLLFDVLLRILHLQRGIGASQDSNSET